MIAALAKLYRLGKKKATRKIYNYWNEGRMSLRVAAKDEVCLRMAAKEHPMFTMIWQHEVADLKIFDVPAPLSGSPTEMTTNTKAYSKRVGVAFAAFKTTVEARGSTVALEASKVLSAKQRSAKKEKKKNKSPKKAKASTSTAGNDEDSSDSEGSYSEGEDGQEEEERESEEEDLA